MRKPLPAFTTRSKLLQRKDKYFLKTKTLSPPQTNRQAPHKSIVAPAFTKTLCPPTPKIAAAILTLLDPASVPAFAILVRAKISLKHPNDQELAFIDAEHESVPAEFRREASGFIVNVEIDNLDELYQNALAEGKLAILAPLETNKYGQRHFITVDPNGMLVDAITMV
jgi:hypothetical protein